MKIYLACPYSHPDPLVREERFRAANQAAATIMQQGHVVFSPISHSHEIARQCALPKGWDFWAVQDLAFVQWCDEVWVLQIPGIDMSRGIAAEIVLAVALKKPVRYYAPDKIGTDDYDAAF